MNINLHIFYLGPGQLLSTLSKLRSSLTSGSSLVRDGKRSFWIDYLIHSDVELEHGVETKPPLKMFQFDNKNVTTTNR